MPKYLGLFLLLSICLSSHLDAQECKVLLSEISGSYSGECKKGLAEGNGMAEGAGIKYEGEFKKGYPHGEGTLSFADGRIFRGEWKNGDIFGYGELTGADGETNAGYYKGTISNFRYLGEDKTSLLGYRVLTTERLENATYAFVNSDPSGNSITIKIFENNIRQITHFEILEITSGIIQLITNEGGRLNAEIVRVNYPITLGLRYILPYGTQDTTIGGGVDNMNSPRRFEFTILEPGNWTVTITHR